MARYIGPKHRLCRQYGEKLCDSPKCPVIKRPYRPGQHGPKGAPRMSEFGLQFREKQKAAKLYGVMERNFHNYFVKAKNMTGGTSENLVKLLEMRLDNTIYRLGFAKSRNAARQIVNHGHVQVNNRKVDIPSYQVKPGDEIRVNEVSLKKTLFVEAAKALDSKNLPSWLTYTDAKTLIGKVVSQPSAEDLKQNFNPSLIIEFYSR